MLPARPFFLIRHGETDMNALRLMCGGGVEAVLNEAGRAQARTAARVLETLAEKPTLIINSGMSRTRETTDILNQSLRLPVLEDPCLREHMLGAWERQPWDLILPRIEQNAKPEGGENALEFAARVRDALIRQLTAHPQERLLFVAHGGTFKALRRLYFGSTPGPIVTPNATLHLFSPDADLSPMPWHITLFSLDESGRAAQERAPFCPSQFK